jgi:outer membrane protein assembly factor BamB
MQWSHSFTELEEMRMLPTQRNEIIRNLFFLLLLLFLAGCQGEIVRSTATVNPTMPSRKYVSFGLDLVEQWRFQAGEPDAIPAYYPPNLFMTSDRVVVGRYIRDGSELPDSNLTALSLQNGHVLWETRLSGQRYGTCITSWYIDLVKGRLFVDYPFSISAFDLVTGQILWTTSMKTHTDERFGYQSADLLLVNTDYGEQISIDPSTGKILSTRKTDLPRMALSNGPITLENSKEGLRAFDQNDNILWDRPYVDAEFWPTFLSNGDLIWQYGRGSYTFERTNSQTGETIWKKKGDYISNYAILGDRLYILQSNGALDGLNLTTGERVGILKFDQTVDPSQSESFWVASNGEYLLVYFGDSQELIAFKPK